MLTRTECFVAALYPSKSMGFFLRVGPRMAMHVSFPSFLGAKFTKHAQMTDQHLVTYGVQGQKTMIEMDHDRAARVGTLTCHLLFTLQMGLNPLGEVCHTIPSPAFNSQDSVRG